MKKSGLAIAVGLLCAFTAQASFQGTVDMSGSSGSFGGGPFTADVTAGLGSVIGGNGLAGAAGDGFRTFCIEFNEHVNLGGSYSADIGTAAIHGSGGPHPDPVSLATAWLYHEFRAGTLSTSVPTYTDSPAGNDALQQAIWWLEEETSAYGVGAPAGSELSFNNYLVTAAVTATGAGSAAAARNIDANGAYNVYALNLYTLNGTVDDVKQSQLAIVPEPSTVIAGVLLLLPFGASAVRILRRKA